MAETILLATDSSPNAERAAAVAGRLAGACGALLVVVHVAPRFVGLSEVTEGPLAGGFPPSVAADIQELLKASQGWEKTPFARIPAPESAVQHLCTLATEAAAKIARDHGAGKVEAVIREGDPAITIVEEARRSNAGFVVMGSRGLGKLESLVLGSVSNKVLQLAECPCVIVK